ncbi:hypothetical protein BMF35_a2012 [Aurantiacibacter gangjinensis]|nr:hypothetical protein BMF35_a2012 [Aurantiacibacter gangjinensis]
MISAIMPCEEPTDATNNTAFLEGWLCMEENAAFIVIVSTGPEAATHNPFTSNFDALVEDVSTSHDTGFVEETEVEGRRTVTAYMGDDGVNGRMRAIQIAPDRVAYAIVMSNPAASGRELSSTSERGVAFVQSLEVNQ